MATSKAKTAETDPVKLMLAYLCVNDASVLGGKVATLDRFGLLDSEQALVCGIDERAITDARYKRKKKTKPEKANKERTR